MASNYNEELPTGWEAKTSRTTGMIYYLNKNTRKSTWDKPVGPAPTEEGEPAVAAPAAPAVPAVPAELIEVKCAHLLIKHRDSRRPTSWREKEITRSKELATEIINGYREKVVNKEVTLQQLARKYSDCSSAKHSGSIGFFKRGSMQKPFEDAAFTLEIGELSQVVETDSGLHVILRTA